MPEREDYIWTDSEDEDCISSIDNDEGYVCSARDEHHFWGDGSSDSEDEA